MTDKTMAVKLLWEALKQPFPADVVGFKPQVAKNGRALPVAYIDARDVIGRLNQVLGLGCWEDTYEVLESGSVMCRLTVILDDIYGEPRRITHVDVGSPSEQPDAGDRLKAAISDALKRAAVKLGLGEYLYRMDLPWSDYDPTKKIFTNIESLRHQYTQQANKIFGVPTAQKSTKPAPAPAPKADPKSAPPPVKPTAEDDAVTTDTLRAMVGVYAKMRGMLPGKCWAELAASLDLGKGVLIDDLQPDQLTAVLEEVKAMIDSMNEEVENEQSIEA